MRFPEPCRGYSKYRWGFDESTAAFLSCVFARTNGVLEPPQTNSYRPHRGMNRNVEACSQGRKLRKEAAKIDQQLQDRRNQSGRDCKLAAIGGGRDQL